MCVDSIDKVRVTKDVLLEQLEDPENGPDDRAAIEHVIMLLPNT